MADINNRVIILDGFYPDPHAVVDVARRANYDRSGIYSHFERTASFFPRNAIEIFESLVSSRIRIDDSWTAPRKSCLVNGGVFNGTFYRVPRGTVPATRIHHDTRDWIGIVWLGVSAPEQDGTAFFRHRVTGADGPCYPAPDLGDEVTHRDGDDFSKWIQTQFVSNRFNRLLLYEGRRYHRACISDPANRLSQLFTFDLEH